MSAVLLGCEVPNTEPWYALRAGGIGASEIAAVVGLSPYMSAFWLWHFKKGNLPGQPVSDAMDWGHRLEPVVRNWWAERHPELVVSETPGTYAHRTRGWQRCNPDGLIYSSPDWDADFPDALYEGKTSRYGTDFGKSGSDEIPLGYRCQIQQSLDIFGLPRAHVAVLIGGNEPREYVIEADPDDQRVLREAGAAFWESLSTDEQPPIDCSDITYEAVRDLNPLIDPDMSIDLPKDLWAEYLHHKNAHNFHKAELTGVKARILDAMGTARLARFAQTAVLRREQRGDGNPYLKEIA